MSEWALPDYIAYEFNSKTNITKILPFEITCTQNITTLVTVKLTYEWTQGSVSVTVPHSIDKNVIKCKECTAPLTKRYIKTPIKMVTVEIEIDGKRVILEDLQLFSHHTVRCKRLNENRPASPPKKYRIMKTVDTETRVNPAPAVPETNQKSKMCKKCNVKEVFDVEVCGPCQLQDAIIYCNKEKEKAARAEQEYKYELAVKVKELLHANIQQNKKMQEQSAMTLLSDILNDSKSKPVLVDKRSLEKDARALLNQSEDSNSISDKM